jgi:hypothetical protein
MTPLDLLTCAAAAYYAAFVMTHTDGPFKLFERLRGLPHGGLLDCFYCLVLWTALLAYALLQTPAFWVVHLVAGAGVASFAFRAIGE